MENPKRFRPDPELRLMDPVRQVLRYHHYAYRTEQTYCDWIMRYIRYHGCKTHPRNMGKKEIDGSCRCEDDRDLYPRHGIGHFCVPKPLGYRLTRGFPSFKFRFFQARHKKSAFGNSYPKALLALSSAITEP